MRRWAFCIACRTLAVAARPLTPNPKLQQLFETEFEYDKYPINVAPSDSSLFAKFLYKSCDSPKDMEKVLADFTLIESLSKTLPVFWERTHPVETIPQLQSTTPQTFFVLSWMQENGMLGNLANVRHIFKAFVDAKQRKVAAKIFLPMSQKESAELLAEAKNVAASLHRSHPTLSSFELEYEIIPESEIVSGFMVDVGGAIYSTATAAAAEVTQHTEEQDYATLPQPKTMKTVWKETVEAELLHKHLSLLAQCDLDEQQYGV